MSSVRPASPEDTRSVVAIVRGLPDYFTDDVPGKVERDLTVRNAWVLTDGGDVRGFVVTARKSAAGAEILWMAVDPAHRGHGHGTRLLNHALSALAADGVRAVEVKTLDPSAGYTPYEATRAFWEHNGFVHIDTIDPLPGWPPGNPAAIYVATVRAATGLRGALAGPELNAGPFRLRPFTLGDLDLIREASADPHIPLITSVPAAFTAEEGRRFVERQWRRPAQGAGYSFAIAESATDLAVGQAGLWTDEAREGRASVGYWVAGSGRGRRAAAFAVLALVRWAHRELRIPRIELQVEPWNTASIRTAELAGFHREGLLRGWQEIGGKRKDLYLYARLADDPLPEIT
jgi:[ribosomal protein S5]-alanine N-acetyltransferase